MPIERVHSFLSLSRSHRADFPSAVATCFVKISHGARRIHIYDGTYIYVHNIAYTCTLRIRIRGFRVIGLRERSLGVLESIQISYGFLSESRLIRKFIQFEVDTFQVPRYKFRRAMYCLQRFHMLSRTINQIEIKDSER